MHYEDQQSEVDTHNIKNKFFLTTQKGSSIAKYFNKLCNSQSTLSDEIFIEKFISGISNNKLRLKVDKKRIQKNITDKLEILNITIKLSKLYSNAQNFNKTNLKFKKAYQRKPVNNNSTRCGYCNMTNHSEDKCMKLATKLFRDRNIKFDDMEYCDNCMLAGHSYSECKNNKKRQKKSNKTVLKTTTVNCKTMDSKDKYRVTIKNRNLTAFFDEGAEINAITINALNDSEKKKIKKCEKKKRNNKIALWA